MTGRSLSIEVRQRDKVPLDRVPRLGAPGTKFKTSRY